MCNCSLCSELQNLKEDNMFFEIFGDKYNNRIITQTENWTSMPTIGCFIRGYILLVTKLHYTSLCLIDEILFKELTELIKYLKNKFLDIYRANYILFEHGSLFCNKEGGQCLDHAHIHMIPFKENLIDTIKSYPFEIHKLGTIYDLPGFVKKINRSYIFFQDFDENPYVLWSTHGIIPSQFMRQVVCKKLGYTSMWDWRHHVFKDNIIKTLDDLK